MMIVKMRDLKGAKLTTLKMQEIVSELSHAIARAGFITVVQPVSTTSIKIANHGCSFVVDVNRLGYNARVNEITQLSCKVGFKRTASPTWTQREEFNHVINNVLDRFKVRANIKSGTYTVRNYTTGRVNQWSMPEPFHTAFGLSVPSVLEIVPLKYAENAVEWIGVNAPFIGAVPEQKPRFIRPNRLPSLTF